MPKIVIDIPEEEYKRIIKGNWLGEEMAEIFENGTPLDEYETIFAEGLLDGLKVSVKAEIERNCEITVNRNNEPAMTLHDVFSIIDKHIEGSNNVKDSD